MQGYKSFTCDTCLFEFGCMAAEHECPKCNSKFDYHPNDYHRKITCTNTKCSQEFGFYMFNVSERVENELRDELKRSQEKWARSQEQRARRAERAVRNAVVEGGVEDVALEAFARGLSNACPLCGSDAFKSTEEQRGHAASCVMDTKAHAVHQKNLARKRAREDAAAGVQQAQEEIQNRAAWEFAGGSTAELWRLALPGLKSLCKDAGLPVTGSKEALIARLSKHRSAQEAGRLLTDGTEEGAAGGKAKRGRVTQASLPSNLAACSVQELRGICAAHAPPPFHASPLPPQPHGRGPRAGAKCRTLRRAEDCVHRSEPGASR
mmetsp:Transcript_40013/g.127967  ORF Transcript_40013/g.127967 Transcript_40013/m.127967 type:complete len:321 (-) Transcript_40013:1054-2016(-)